MNRRSLACVRSLSVALLLPLVAAATAPEAEPTEQVDIVEDDAAEGDEAGGSDETVEGEAGAAVTAVPTVTLRPGPTSELHHLPECSDVVEFDEAATNVAVLERSDGADGPLEVAITEVGPAIPGEDHEALPASITFPAGVDEVALTVTPLAGQEARIVELEVHLAAGDGYEIGEPDRARLVFLRPKAVDAPPRECGFGIIGAPELTRATVVGGRPDDIVVGEVLVPSGLFPLAPEQYRARVVAGVLPAGLTLAEDGTFAGAAAEVGRTVATIEACRTGPPGTCQTAELTITVAAATDVTTVSEPATPEQLPATGIGSSTGLLIVGMAQLGVGTVLLRTSRRDRRRTPAPGKRTS